MTAEEILTNLLEIEPPEYLAKLCNELNCWQWPPVLGECPFTKDALMSEASLHIRPLTNMIRDKIGEYEIFKYWHLTVLGRTFEYFENWWDDRINLEKNSISENKKIVIAAIKSLLSEEGRINQSFDKEVIYQEYLKIKNCN